MATLNPKCLLENILSIEFARRNLTAVIINYLTRVFLSNWVILLSDAQIAFFVGGEAESGKIRAQLDLPIWEISTSRTGIVRCCLQNLSRGIYRCRS